MTGQTTIYRPDGSELVTVTHTTDSFRRWQVMAEHAVTLKFEYAGFLTVPVGSYITYKGRRYTLYNPSDFTKNGQRKFEYTLKLHAPQELLNDTIFINAPDGRTSFTRTARPHEFLEALVWNMNGRPTDVNALGEWTVGAYIDARPQTIAFNNTTCAEALRLFAETFKTEYEVDVMEISLHKVERFKAAPLTLQYGQGNGFKPGLGRGNYDDNRPVNRLFVNGGERNIDFSTYGSQTLLLPAGQSISYDGSKFEDEDGFDSTLARTYIVSDDGRSLTRTDTEPVSNREGSVELTEIYPMREGTVTGVEATPNTGDGENDYYDFFDNTIPAALDYSQYRMNGEKMIVVFQTGMLAGREFDLEQTDDAVTGYVHTDPNDPTKNRRFKLVSQQQDGFIMPGGNFIPRVGDRYAVFGMSMPTEYIREDNTKSGASWDMFREAVRYKYENEEQRFTFKGELDGIYAQEHWDEIEDKIIPGGYVDFSDPQFQPDGVLIRIAAIKEYLHQPYKPQLELTNIVIGGGVRGEINKIEQQEVVIDERIRDIGILSNRQWRDTQELRRRLSDLHLGFTEAITPINVQTMHMIAGSEQLQFRFVNNRTAPVEVSPTIVYNPTENTLQVQAGIIQHMTLGIDAISGTHALSEYKFWNVNAYTSDEPLEKDKLYWLYARVPRDGTAGSFVVTTEEMPFDTDPAYYNLLVGALNSEYDGDRSYTSLYGFTEILPGQIIVNMIRSNDGKNFIDFVNNAVRIGGESVFLEWANGVFRLKGAIVQSPSGAEDVIGVFRGTFDYYTTYHKGEEVFYNGTTYRYINSTPSAYATPPNSTYWAVRASEGRYTTQVFQTSASQPSTPNTTSLVPFGWSTQPTAVSDGQAIWASTSVVQQNSSGTWYATGWSTPRQWSGKDGLQGRMLNFVGDYSSSKIYKGDNDVSQVVKYNGQYWYSKNVGGTFSGYTPSSSSSYWASFGASFESVATDVLYAKDGTLGSFAFNFATKEFRSADGDGIILNSETGEATFNKATIRGYLQGITGSFKSLDCVDSNGNVVGGISFDSYGRMWFSGDLYHQGTKNGRDLRFYTSNIWCRGSFGASSRNAMVVYGSYAYYYPDGLNRPSTRVYCSLSSTTVSGQTYYDIPLYNGSIDAVAGFPVDVVIFSVSSAYYYALSGSVGKTVKVVNANGNNSVYLYSNGFAKELYGGGAGELIRVSGFLSPTVSSTVVGEGWLFTSFYDNNWN